MPILRVVAPLVIVVAVAVLLLICRTIARIVKGQSFK
jgi:hypothetical protein